MIEFSSEEPAPLLLRYPIMAVFAASMRAQTLVGGCDFDSALRMHQAGDLAAAAAGYNDCLAADPGRVDARSNLGAVLVKMGRYRDLRGLEGWEDKSVGRSAGWFNRGFNGMFVAGMHFMDARDRKSTRLNSSHLG